MRPPCPTSARRGFVRIVGSSAVIAAAAPLLPASSAMPDAATEPWRLADRGEDVRRRPLSWAILAPNPHSLQPWMVELPADGSIVLFTDPTRTLPMTDPPSRQVPAPPGRRRSPSAPSAPRRSPRSSPRRRDPASSQPARRHRRRSPRSTTSWSAPGTSSSARRAPQLEAGRAFLRLQLQAAALGLVTQPPRQVLQEYPEMRALQREFEARVGQREGARVQMLVRVGHPTGAAVRSPRRALQDVVRG
jgi:hypothetical protein